MYNSRILPVTQALGMLHGGSKVAASQLLSSLFVNASCCSALEQASFARNVAGKRSSHMAKLYAGAAERNARPILDVLRRSFVQLQPESASCRRVLEFASGTGQHTVSVFAEGGLLGEHGSIQPSEIDESSIQSIVAYRDESCRASQILDPLHLDVTTDPRAWGVESGAFDVVFCCNMVHISPWETTAGLFRAGAHVLRSGGLIVMYGPFSVDGDMVDSNRQFDLSLRSRDARWGIRDLRDVSEQATACGFELQEKVAMPANNMILLYQKRG